MKRTFQKHSNDTAFLSNQLRSPAAIIYISIFEVNFSAKIGFCTQNALLSM